MESVRSNDKNLNSEKEACKFIYIYIVYILFKQRSGVSCASLWVFSQVRTQQSHWSAERNESIYPVRIRARKVFCLI